MTVLHGGPLDGARVSMDDDELEFTFVSVEPVGGTDSVTVLHRYTRTEPGAEFAYNEDVV